MFGAIVLAYNLPGSPKLNLDSATVAGIFLGKITKWNDPAIVALNPDVKLPDAEIKPCIAPTPPAPPTASPAT